MASWADDEMEEIPRSAEVSPKPSETEAQSKPDRTTPIKRNTPLKRTTKQQNQPMGAASARWLQRAAEGQQILEKERLEQTKKSEKQRGDSALNRRDIRNNETKWERTTYPNDPHGTERRKATENLKGAPEKDSMDTSKTQWTRTKYRNKQEDVSIPSVRSNVNKKESQSNTNGQDNMEKTSRPDLFTSREPEKKLKYKINKKTKPAESVSAYLEAREKAKSAPTAGFDYGYVTYVTGESVFIRCVSQKDSIFDVSFKQSTATKVLDVSVGDEVEFKIDKSPKKLPGANSISILRKGSIVLDEPVAKKENCQGVVVRDTQRGRKYDTGSAKSSIDPFYGKILVMLDSKKQLALRPAIDLKNPTNEENLVSFSKRGIPYERHLAPKVGDLVSFNIVRDIASGQIHATGINVVKKEAERYQEIVLESTKNSTEETGTIFSLARQRRIGPNSIGTISTDERDSPIEFRYKDLSKDFQASFSPKSRIHEPVWRGGGRIKPKLASGLKVKFFAIPDPLDDTKEVAVMIVPAHEDLQTGEYIVSTVVALTSDRETPGLLEPVTGTKEGAHEKQIQFGHDVKVFGPKPSIGDLVRHDLTQDSGGNFVAKSILVETPIGEEARTRSGSCGTVFGLCKRETGVVGTLNPSYGFIECFDREGSIFFPFSEVVRSPKNLALLEGKPREEVDLLKQKAPLALGSSVSFDVTRRTGPSGTSRVIAARVLQLPKGCPDSRVNVEDDVDGIVVSTPTESMLSAKVSRFGKIRFMPNLAVNADLYGKLADFRDRKAVFQNHKSLFLVLHNLDEGTKLRIREDHHEGVELWNKDVGWKVNMCILKLAKEYSQWLSLSAVEITNNQGDLAGVSITRGTELQAAGASAAAYFTMDLMKQTVSVGDKVVFSLAFDKSRLLHLAISIRVTRKANPDAPLVEKANTDRHRQTGIIGSIQEKGFGFIQCVEREMSLFFHLTDCDSSS